MNSSDFQQQIVGTAACMNITMKDNKVCGQLLSNDTFFADRWFSGVKTAEKVMVEGVYYCGSMNTIHKRFCLGYVGKINGRVSVRVSYCYEKYSKSSW